MAYTKSKDGKMRKNIHFTVRLKKEEVHELDKRCRAHGYKNFCEYMERELSSLTYWIHEKLPLESDYD